MLLFTPGPTPVPEFIRSATNAPTLHHRTPEFEEIFSKTRDLLKEMIGLQEVIMLASSGSGAMEACLTSLCAQKVLIINSGKFGERFVKIAQAFGIAYLQIENEWDTPASLDFVLQAIKDHPDIDAVCLQVCESSGGLRHPYEEIAQGVKEVNADIMVIIDAITALGVEYLNVDYVDALIGGSQKAFMLPTGLSMIGLSQKAIEKINKANAGFYFNLKTELKNQQKNTTAWTPATTVITGLYAFLQKAKEIGFMNIYNDVRARSCAFDATMEILELKIYPKIPAMSMTTVIDDEADMIRKILKEKFDVIVAGGQDRLSGKIFRINHMGFIPLYETLWVVNAIELSLAKLRRKPFTGVANQLFLDKYYSLRQID